MAIAGCPVETPLLVIVDDDASMRISTQRLIRSFGFRANVFSSAQEFLESGCIHDNACVILDLRMPSMDGLQLQRLLASRSYQIPIIFVTAHGNDQDEREAMKAGAVGFLHKPVSKEALLKAIQTALMHATVRE
jgi:two-component system, LuxR family, response regulator FixJ